MTTSKRKKGKKYFSVAEANATLPLVRSIVKDITELAVGLRERHERLTRLGGGDRGVVADAYQEELQTLQQDLDRAQDQMKDYYTGLIDFPAWRHGHEVYLCWRLGEPEVAHWHELDAGFAGRQKLSTEEVHSS